MKKTLKSAEREVIFRRKTWGDGPHSQYGEPWKHMNHKNLHKSPPCCPLRSRRPLRWQEPDWRGPTEGRLSAEATQWPLTRITLKIISGLWWRPQSCQFKAELIAGFPPKLHRVHWSIQAFLKWAVSGIFHLSALAAPASRGVTPTQHSAPHPHPSGS